ncbi:Rrs1 protein [Martiniozyma asiatica (nom. inval.)]|nr:Rrs1 protein [Martiniozyma asiatica]
MSEEPEYKPVTVDKSVPVNYDMGNLAIFDPQPLDSTKITNFQAKEEYLTSLTRDNVQLLVNQLLSLPVQKSANDDKLTLIQLPAPTTQLPREKSIPKPKELTKWEKFAAKKGIQKKGKEGKMVFDEQSGEWVPKWGYKGNNKKVENEWLVEVNDENEKVGDDGDLIDPRKLDRMERKKLIKKNLLQQKRNLMNGK